MVKRSKKQARRLRNLIMVCAMCAVVLTVSTYAWFIGMKTVSVSSFDVEIATTEGLFLSMDGVNWSYKLDARNATPYQGNTNTWATTGLIPMSTVGDMDDTVSRMKLYEKASLTTTTGGFRLLSSRVENYVTEGDEIKQGKGYVAFDLFIKNLSGEHYYVENNEKNEEAIYLKTDSEVTVGEGGIGGTGIENSVRVAFTQIGRVKADTGEDDVAAITGITCKNSKIGDIDITGICRNAQIWEPNDTHHVTNAINWYQEACATRKETGTKVNEAASYNVTETTRTKCGTVEEGETYATYAVSRDLVVEDHVDIYDGTVYNTYTSNTTDYDTYIKNPSRKADYKLVEFPYFTDSMKNEIGTDRPTFMTLAPNSITKLRVYVYIEGQDIDNYDFASLGAKISVKFGFTKERFTEDDIHYVGPSTDITPTEGDEIVATPNEEIETPEN